MTEPECYDLTFLTWTKIYIHVYVRPIMNFSVQEFKVVMVYAPKRVLWYYMYNVLFSPYLPKTLPFGNFFFNNKRQELHVFVIVKEQCNNHWKVKGNTALCKICLHWTSHFQRHIVFNCILFLSVFWPDYNFLPYFLIVKFLI